MKTPSILRFTRRERINFPRDKLSYDVTHPQLATHPLLRLPTVHPGSAHSRDRPGWRRQRMDFRKRRFARRRHPPPHPPPPYERPDAAAWSRGFRARAEEDSIAGKNSFAARMAFREIKPARRIPATLRSIDLAFCCRRNRIVRQWNIRNNSITSTIVAIRCENGVNLFDAASHLRERR